MRNTIDEVLLSGFGEKLDSAQLALDSQLIEATVEVPDLSAVLAAAMKNFDPTAPTHDEQEMEAQWRETLRDLLRAAEHLFRIHHRPAATLTVLPDPSQLARALAARRKAQAQLKSA